MLCGMIKSEVFAKMIVSNLNRVLLYALIAICFVSSMVFVYHNHSFYERPIAMVMETNLVETEDIVDIHNNKDMLFTQTLIAELKNGEHKGQLIQLTNEYSSSKAFDQEYKPGNEVFVSIDDDREALTGSITDVKRDKYLMIVSWVFIFTLLFVGQKQGLLSIISLAVNALLLSYALDVYIHTSGISLLWICSVAVILFTVISLLLVNGFNEKTYAAIAATLLGTFISQGCSSGPWEQSWTWR
jgi:uncharacterized membrane protein